MSDENEWPLTFERVRGHWIGLAFACFTIGGRLVWQGLETGWRSLLHVAPIALALVYGFLSYWAWRAIDYTGWRTMSRYLPRR